MSISENKGGIAKRIPALAVLALSLVMLIGSQTFLAPCVHEDGSFGSCHWAGQMMLGIGGLICLLSLSVCLAKDRPMRRGIYLAMIPASFLGILTPGTLIPLCRMNTMRCRMIMQPAMVVLCVLAVLAALAGILLERKRG